MVVMMTNFIENMIFENEKEKVFLNSRYFYKMLIEKYKISNYLSYSEVYKRICNYQIMKYGERVGTRIGWMTKEECYKLSNNAFKRKKQRLERVGEKK